MLDHSNLTLSHFPGWVTCSALLISLGGPTALAFVAIVGRARRALDFAVTLFVSHVLATTVHSGVPDRAFWWVLNVAGAGALAFVAEAVSLRLELRDISVSGSSGSSATATAGGGGGGGGDMKGGRVDDEEQRLGGAGATNGGDDEEQGGANGV